ncbi:MAG TPA: AMP-binding protein, partial [Burkholderiaceae bacterium]|nr:AMP-binding protein [Burkholderiaceae bacterium]
MNDPLSITAAARDAADAIALHVGRESYTFAQLADLVRTRLAALGPELKPGQPVPLVGRNTLERVIALYTLLEARVPVLLLHPKVTDVERAAEIAATERAARTLPADAAVILYTSGTTGEARGAVLTRSALLASAQASSANLGWQSDDCWLLAMPLARIGGLSILTRCLIARRAVALAPSFDAARLPQWIEQWRTTLVSLVPTMLTLLFEKFPDWRPSAFLRGVLVGGAEASPRLLKEAARRKVPVVITYGCTETCSQVVATPYEQRFNPAPCGAGRPLPGAEMRVVDGRIEARGPMRMAGYLGAAPLGAAAWFDTGDIGVFDARGCLHVRARRADLIVSGGENVYPAEVERVLEACHGIRAAAVFGVPDETWGEVVAAAFVADGAPPT